MQIGSPADEESEALNMQILKPYTAPLHTGGGGEMRTDARGSARLPRTNQDHVRMRTCRHACMHACMQAKYLLLCINVTYLIRK